MRWMRSKFAALSAPVLSTGLLVGATCFQRDWPARSTAEPYHRHAAAAIAAIPMQIGPWVGKNIDPPRATLQVLRPNAIRNIEFIDPRVGTLEQPTQRLAMSLVQTRRSNDMLGHFPPNCYPGLGDQMTGASLRHWLIPAPDAVAGAKPLLITGMEYRFDRVINGTTYRRIVYNFMVAPGRGILPDMNRLEEAAEDYQQRYCGAAQFQVVFGSVAGQELPEAQRDETFRTLMRACGEAIAVLSAGR